MNALSTGIEVISTQSGQAIASSGSPDVYLPSYLSPTVTYSSLFTFEVVYQINEQSLSVVENNILKIIPDLTCSLSGSTTILYSINNYMSSIAPSWISINSDTGELTITPPTVNSNTEYYFYVNSEISGISDPVQKLIKLTVQGCHVSNWLKCSSTSDSICSTCNIGFVLNYDVWSVPISNKNSETSKALSSAVTTLVGAIFGLSILTSFINISSIASLWMSINQLQMFFLLLITRSYIPEDIKSFITGLDYALNIYEYISLRKLGIYPSLLNDFENNSTNSLLDPLKIQYDSTVANTYTIFGFLCCMIIFHIFISILRWLQSKFLCNERWSWLSKLIKWIVEKIFNFMTFSFYIRNTLELSQFILVSSTNEIYQIKTSNPFQIASYIFSILMIALYLMIITSTVYLALSSYKLEKEKHNYLGELFTDLKNSKKSKLYVAILLLRRLAYVTLLITLVSTPSRVLVSIITFIQILYAVYIVYWRPYEEVKINIIEIVNEAYFSVLLLILAFVNCESDWSSIKTSAYMWLLVSNTVAIFIVILGKEHAKFLLNRSIQ